MLDDKRIQEAEKNVKRYLEDGLINRIQTERANILDTYRRNQEESIDLAKKIFDQDISNLWVVVISYYSMYYAANAVLYKLGYKVGSKVSHKVTADSLIVFIRNKLKKSLLEDYEDAKEEALDITGRQADDIISDYHNELEKRSFFQYETTEIIKRAKAKTSLERAKKFVFEMEKLLKAL